MRKTLLISSLLASAILLAACGASPTNQAELSGTHWVLVELIGADVVTEGNQEMTLNFDEEELNGYSGCNQFSAGYSANQSTGTLEVSPLTTTLMACMDEEVMAREGEYQSALQAAESYTLDGNILIIESADGTLRFERTSEEG